MRKKCSMPVTPYHLADKGDSADGRKAKERVGAGRGDGLVRGGAGTGVDEDLSLCFTIGDRGVVTRLSNTRLCHTSS